MARWPRRVLIVALVGASAVAGCFLGGQTGEAPQTEPPGGTCVSVVPAGEKVSGVSPADLAHAFEGSHTAQLVWTSFPDGGSGQGGTITIVITYQGDAGTACSNLEVPVSVEVITSDGAVHASGFGTLASAVGSTSAAKLSFGNGGPQLSADLKQVNGMVTLSGTVSDGKGHTGVLASPGILGTGGAPGTP
jgi:hypothetical protein